MRLFRQSSLSAALALCAIGLPLMASAAEPAPVMTQVSVQTGDLDLATARGQGVLRHRIRKASMQVCRTENPSESLMSDQMLACQTEAMQRTTARVQALVQFAEASRAVSLEASAVPR